jgi:3'-phosphoadenosine 5'-phosphosulfate synthase
MGTLRAKALESSPPHIIECSAASAGGSQDACHLPAETRYAALGQKGATLWMTGCSGAGKTTIATALEDRLIKEYGKHVYRLDGDNLRTGLNRDLSFSEADRAESVRRTGEMATLFADSGVITLVGLISPYRGDRDAVRKRHEDQGIPFYEIFLDVPVDELKKRDPKGQYARVESGELKHFTCIDDPYEEPLYPEITLKTHELKIEESADQLFRMLETDGILEGAPKLTPPGLPNPDGDVVVDLHVPSHLKAARKAEAETLPKVLISDIDLNWLQVIGEGWASPLKGFMREGTLLETLHFNSILVDPFNITGNQMRHEMKTDFATFSEHQPPSRVSMSVPITLPCTSFSKDAIESSDKNAIALVTQMGQTVAILRDPEVYNNRKEEIVTRMFGAIDMDHPYIKTIYSGGDYLIGGEIELLDRIKYNDGLDKWRKTASELMDEFQSKGADTVYAFQTRNPTHAGHAYLMRSAGEDLKKQGYKKPVLWLSPLGGWTKEDDVPLDVRVNQHEEVLRAG